MEKRDKEETRKTNKMTKQKVLNVGGGSAPNSCIVYVRKSRWRCLIDTGADVSLISEKMYTKIKHKSKLQPTNQVLQGAGESSLTVKGITEITFRLGKSEYTHKCYVIKGASRNMIIGMDFLKKHKAVIYINLEKLKLHDEYIDLEEDLHIASVVRLAADVSIAPQKKITVTGKVKESPYFKENQLCEFVQDKKSCTSDEPGLLLANSVSALSKRQCQVLIVNSTNKTYTLKRGSVLGTMSRVQENEIKTLAEITQHNTKSLPTTPDFSDAKIPDRHRDIVTKVLEKNKDVFAAHDTDFGRTETVTMKIDTQGHAPIKQRPYRTPLAQHRVVDEAIDEMLNKGIIERSNSPWASPVVLVKKKDGSTRFCVDYRKLNACTTPLAVPLPLIDDLLGVLGKAVYFSSLDLISGYWQVMMDPQDREKTAFCTSHRGLFEFLTLPFGLMNGPGVFSQLISQVLQGCEEFAVGYIDDILCFSESLEDHLKHLTIIFQKLREHGLKLKLRKCSFLQSETSYLGYRLTNQGIKPEDDKIKAIRELEPPTTKKEVRSFIGSCSYYRKFLPNFSGIAKPLIELTKKNTRFKWGKAHQESFDFLKASLTEIPFLAYPDVSKPFILYTDASDLCIGACLTQQNELDEEEPVYFLSHKLSDTQTRWSTIEKEAYAVFYAIQKLHYILYGAQFTIKTDHQPLIYLLRSPSNNKKVQNWMMQLSSYACTIEHIKGTENTMADMLSRAPAPSVGPGKERQIPLPDLSEPEIEISDKAFHIQTLNSNKFTPKQFASFTRKPETMEDDLLSKQEVDMVEEQKKDPEIRQVIEDLKTKSGKNRSRFLVDNEIVYYLSDPHGDPVMRLFVPIQLRAALVKAYHDENGHFGVDKCYKTLARSYYWKDLFMDLRDYIARCIQCNQRNLRKTKPPITETEIPPYAFAKISLDMAGPFPLTLSGNRYIVSFVDWLTGWIESFATADKSGDTVLYLLMSEIFPRFGCPLVLVTDNGGENVNKAMKETLDKLKIHHVTTSVFHPQSNAKVERSHRTMNDILSKLMEHKRCNTWDLLLPQALAAMRFSYNDSTGQAPFSLVYGRDVVLPIDTLLQPRRRYYGEELHRILLDAQHEQFVRVHRRMKKQKKRQARYANRNTKEIDFRVGDPVYLKNHKKTCKLSSAWEPYYRIIEQKSPLTFRIKNQMTGEVTSTHAEHLALATTEWDLTQQPPPEQGRTRVKYVVSDESSSHDSQSDEDDRYHSPLKKKGSSDAQEKQQHTPSLFESRPEDVAEKEDEENFFSMGSMSSDEGEMDDNPLQPLARTLKRQREGSSSEDDIPLAELSRRLKMRKSNEDEICMVRRRRQSV